MQNDYYDFSEERLWLTRFLPIDDAIQTVEQHLTDTITSLDGVSLEYIDQFLARQQVQGVSILNDLKQVIWQKLQALALVSGTPLEEVSNFLSDEGVIDDVAAELTGFLGDAAKKSAQKMTHAINPELANSASIEDAHDRDFELIQLTNLGIFSRSLRQFVHESLLSAARAALADNHLYSAAGLIRACFQHVFEDIQTVEQAVTQRSWQLTPDGQKQMGPQARALLVSDKLAMMALAPARPMLSANRSARPSLPITFFSQDTYFHHTPYRDDLLLIGISYDHILLGLDRMEAESDLGTTNNEALPAFELMAIPHEVGHYLYQHGQLGGTPIAAITAQIFGDYPQLFNWREEIFADIYSCIVAGSLAALGLQALIASSANGTICASDGEHPTGDIRPFILTQILALLHEALGQHYPNQDVLAQLDENWRWNLAMRHITPAEPIPFAPIQQLIYLLLNELDLERDGQPIPLPWSSTFHPSLKLYDEEMAQLVQVVFDLKEMPNHQLADEVDPMIELALPAILAKWGDDWDTPKGRGTLGDQKTTTGNKGSSG